MLNNLSNLKIKVDKLDINKLVPVPVDLSKLTNVVKNEVVKKTEYNAKIKNIEDKIPDISNLVTKTNLNTKISEVKNEMPSINGLVTTSALTAVENKIPSISNLVKKTYYNTKITEIIKKFTDHKHDEYITTPEFHKLAAVFNARLAQANLVTKADFDAKLSSLNRKITSNRTKHLLSENELSYFHSKNYFDESDMQNYYIFQPVGGYLTTAYTNNISYISLWQSRGLSNLKIDSIKTNNYLLKRIDDYDMDKIRIKFDASLLNRFPPGFLHENIVNIYIVYEVTSKYNNSNYPTLENCLFGSVQVTKNANIDKYGYSGYGIEFHRKAFFPIGVDMSLS